MPQTTVTANDEGSVNLQVSPITNATEWTNNVRNASVASIAGSGGTGTSSAQVIFLAGRGGGTGVVNRIYMYFDGFGTAVKMGNITGLTLTIHSNQTSAQNNPVSIAKSGFTGLESSGLVVDDYDAVDFNTLYGPSAGSTAVVDGLTGEAIYTATLNSDAISDANTNGFLRICILNRKFDFNNSTISSGINDSSSIRINDSSLPNQLVIDYDDRKVAGVGLSSVAKINGVTLANIGKLSGI